LACTSGRHTPGRTSGRTAQHHACAPAAPQAEEDRIIIAELELLKQRLSDPKLDKTRGREYMVRLLYCEMLGHDASFAYVKVLQFASESNIHTKKARRKGQRGGRGAP
jgi:hypothetical protein